jgi:ribonuclease BN (tRNA processing enzyme)
MLIRCWGARGSIPVSGPQYLRYGGDTTCIEIRTRDDDIIIIDAGSGLRALGNRLLQENRYRCTMLFTHGHWDHIMGFPFFKPLYDSRTRIDILGCPFTQNSIQEILAPSMSPPNFPIKFEDLKAGISYHGACSGNFTVNSLSVTTTLLSHPNQGIGFKFVEDGKTFVFLTDNELAYQHPGGLNFEDYRAFCRGADLLIHDAEYTEKEYARTKTWGHSVYTDALRLAAEAQAGQLGLFHHNQDRTDDAVDAIVEDCRRLLAEQGLPLSCFGVAEGMELRL